MHLILTHENADFDAVASQLGVHKLNPEALPLLPRRVNRNVFQFLTLYWDLFPYRRSEDWKRKRVEKVTLVDTQSVPNVRGIRKKLEVQVIDHHMPPETPESWQTHIEAVGATVTLLAEMLQTRGVYLTPEEATLLLLGIYEDTGTLTYDTTTTRDALAAGWLIEQGARLGVVRRFLNIPLTEQQQELFARLQDNMEWLKIEGQSVVLAATKAPPDFSDEISSIAHRLRDALVPDALLLLVELPNHVQLVARSTSDQVDVGEVARHFGGGGHDRAAAATILRSNLEKSRQAMKALLQQIIKPMVRVADIMSQGVQTIESTCTVAEAENRMQRLGHEGYPVVDEDGRLVGLLTRRMVDRAVRHEMGNTPVRQVMRAGEIIVRPQDSVQQLQQLMIDAGWGQIPVTAPEGNELIGIVTRTDLINLWSKPGSAPTEPSMRRRLSQLLAAPVWSLVQAASDVAADAGLPFYFVGGLVRDMLLGMSPTDVDMVVEGDAIALARHLQKQFGGRVRSHSRFGTAKWMLSPENWRKIAPDNDISAAPESVDFVTARAEFYNKPTALPEIEQGSIKLDLHRRDFTINTLAIRLDGGYLGQLLDFYGGRRDLDQGIIRVLHSLSFIDDPTRILRAVRFEQRLGFDLDPRTAELIGDALPLLDRVSGARIRHEIELSLLETDPAATIARLDNIGALDHIQEGLTWTPGAGHAFQEASRLMEAPAWKDEIHESDRVVIYFLLWLLPHPNNVQQATAERLRVRKTTRTDLSALRGLMARLMTLENPSPSQVYFKVTKHDPPQPRVLLAALAEAIALENEALAQWLAAYKAEWAHTKTALDGHDLQEMGVPRGPEIQEILDGLLAARLDGEIQDARGEKEWVERWQREHRTAGSNRS